MTDNSNLSIILSGSFDENSIIAVLSEKFNSLSGKTISLVPSEISVITSRLTAINKDESNQAAIRLGRKMIDRNNPDFPYVQIANMIFGGFFLSRLNKILREEKGYTYGIHSLIDSRRQSTIQMIASSIKIDTLAESIGIISEVNSGLISNPISPDELKRAVRYILGSFLRSTETPQQISSLIQTLDMFGFDRKFYSDYYDKISSATLEDVHRVVHSHFTADDFVITAAGDLNIIRPQLEEFGNVEIIELN
jgi:predicted Zn-dependent peptidase